ncbi:hypothetical protein EYC80_009653 [Monilinia laxa]|uniref:Uncharacterized protein n=1 Tax=Monilinia laxa TaxID=61186 RepID=A0A5N6JYX5_MONLA|nr:hypothetical protein EYC80_009653 [Monilinia laxa]
MTENRDRYRKTQSPSPIHPFTPQDLEYARKEFPNEKLASRALEKWARDREWRDSRKWFWKDNYRYMCGSDAWYYDKKLLRCKKVRSEVDSKKYLISLDDPPTLSEIDQPKPASVRRLVANRSESQWALPREDPHHLLKFPQEILDSIFEFTLIDKNHKISPDVTTTNKQIAYKMHQTYTLDGERYTEEFHTESARYLQHLILSTIVAEQCYDSEGKYFVLRKVHRQAIDATLLRVCKSICTQATKMLYGGNVFKFTMTEIGKKGHSGMLIGDEIYPMAKEIHWRRWEEDFQTIVQNSIEEVESQAPVMSLAFHIYYDHFARFLHTIGLTKAAMIKNLHFDGIIQIHSCSSGSSCTERGSKCEKDLIGKLQLYIPLINKFCTNLQTLVINIREDVQVYEDNWDIDWADRRRRADLELRSLLENEIRELKTVRNLEIYKVESRQYDGTTISKMEAGEETEVWFKKRADRSLHEELEMAKSQKGVENMRIGEDGGIRSAETTPCMFWLK